MPSIKKALFFSFANNYLSLVINFISVLVIARLLTPGEIGTFSIAAAFFGITHMLRDFGISNYIVQEKELTKEKLAAAFTLSLGLCYSLAGVFFVFSHQIADFFNEPATADVFNLLAINLLLIPFGTLTLSLLKRDLHFDKLTIINTCSNLVNAATAISLAVHGYSVLSLAFASLAGTITTVAVAQFFRPPELPKLPGLSKLRTVYRFGWKMSLSNVFTYLENASPDLIIGKLLGPTSVAFFNRASATTTLFSKLISAGLNPFLQSYLSQLNREGKNTQVAFKKATEYTILLAWPFFGFIAFNPVQIITVLYGEQWLPAVPFVWVFALGYSFLLLTSNLEIYLTSVGKAKELLRITAILTLVKIGILTSFSFVSLSAAVYSTLLLIPIRWFIYTASIHQHIGIKTKDYLIFAKLPFLITLLIGLASMAFNYVSLHLFTGDISIYIDLIVRLIGTGIIWLACLYIFRHPLLCEAYSVFRKAK